ncbi:hypothetical protein ADUPG1_014290, partial [Aduncisulcus paluster]
MLPEKEEEEQGS